MMPADAWYLFAEDLRTDQFLVYGFAGCPVSVERAVGEAAERARACCDLRLKVDNPRSGLGFPRWVLGDVEPGQIIVHNSDQLDWPGFLQATSRLIEQHRLDTAQAMWRLHVFVGVHGVPASPGLPSTVAVVQMSHALADGVRSSALAGVLFGRSENPPEVAPLPFHFPFARSFEALRARRELARDTAAGRVAEPAGPVPALSTNNTPNDPPILRTFVRHRTQLPGKSATIGALIAISEALSGYLLERGEDPSSLTALVPMANAGLAHAHNHSGPEFIRLFPDVTDRAERARLLAAEFADRKNRRQHAALATNALALANLPGPLLRWIQSRALPQSVMGNAVVSSVNRGPADLTFGGCPVVMSAGYPFLTPEIGLTHGIHGIGEMVSISVNTTASNISDINTTASNISDIEEYLDRLNFGLRPQL